MGSGQGPGSVKSMASNEVEGTSHEYTCKPVTLGLRHRVRIVGIRKCISGLGSGEELGILLSVIIFLDLDLGQVSAAEQFGRKKTCSQENTK